ncbi:hypothetical protein SDC9_195252 [bioreactor metagenome]|uniref:Uncharacterized protein n=1 Tax=bioreactor metagenome TaxID=1076179 RepID=A0A645IB32_9ZZZZ
MRGILRRRIGTPPDRRQKEYLLEVPVHYHLRDLRKGEVRGDGYRAVGSGILFSDGLSEFIFGHRDAVAHQERRHRLNIFLFLKVYRVAVDVEGTDVHRERRSVYIDDAAAGRKDAQDAQPVLGGEFDIGVALDHLEEKEPGDKQHERYKYRRLQEAHAAHDIELGILRTNHSAPTPSRRATRRR